MWPLDPATLLFRWKRGLPHGKRPLVVVYWDSSPLSAGLSIRTRPDQIWRTAGMRYDRATTIVTFSDPIEAQVHRESAGAPISLRVLKTEQSTSSGPAAQQSAETKYATSCISTDGRLLSTSLPQTATNSWLATPLGQTSPTAKGSTHSLWPPGTSRSVSAVRSTEIQCSNSRRRAWRKRPFGQTLTVPSGRH